MRIFPLFGKNHISLDGRFPLQNGLGNLSMRIFSLFGKRHIFLVGRYPSHLERERGPKRGDRCFQLGEFVSLNGGRQVLHLDNSSREILPKRLSLYLGGGSFSDVVGVVGVPCGCRGPVGVVDGK